MNIIWNENPLLTQIMLDEHEKKEFWYKIKVGELQETMISAYFHLDEGRSEFYKPNEAKEELDPEFFCPEWNDGSKKGTKSKLDERVDSLFKYFIEDLEINPHGGDCTCVACSCSKCHAENILGIDTIKGLGKHEASAIQGAFKKRGTEFPERNNQHTIDEAIVHLEQWIPEAHWEGAEAHFERWINENVQATTWLKRYRKEHFSG